MYAIDAYVHTNPPNNVPVPIPKFHIPEYMDMATAVASCGANLMSSSCNATLNMVMVNPIEAHIATTVSVADDDGYNSAKERVTPATDMLVNVDGLLL